MKKIIFLSLVFLLAGFSTLTAQNLPHNRKPHPIPSYRTLMVGNDAWQDYNTHGNNKEKRDINVRVSIGSYRPGMGDAKVWVVKDWGNFVLGPYYVHFDEVLSVPVDWGSWGAVVQCSQTVSVDVWFSTSGGGWWSNN